VTSGAPNAGPSNRTAALALFALLVLFAILHAYWALGGSWGLETAIGPGTARPAPGPIWAMAVVQGLFAIAALAVWRSAGDAPPAARVALWVLAAGAALVACMNIVLGTRPAERYGVGSFALLIAVLALLSVRRGRVSRSSEASTR
jgi:hypothetical protein